MRELFEFQRLGNRAVLKAQEENRRLGIPNRYSINGVIVSEQQISNMHSDSANDENKKVADD